MEEKKTIFWRKAALVFLVFGCVVILVLFVMFLWVMFNDSVEVFAKRILGAESERDVVAFIISSAVGILASLIVVMINNSTVAQATNYSMEKAKEFCRKFFAWFLVLVGVVGFVWLFRLVLVIFNERVEYQMMVSLGVESKWEVIEYIGLNIAGVLVFLTVVSVIRWVVAQVENNTKKMEEIWRKAVIGFLFFVGVLGLLLFALLFAVMFDERVKFWAMEVLGVSDEDGKQEVIKFISSGIAGILAFFGAITVNKRAEAQVQTAAAQVGNNELVEKGHIDERFKAAVEHLGNKDESARIASFYEFSYLVRDNDKLQKHIFDILRAHLRRVTNSAKYKEEIKFSANRKNLENVRTTEEVQCLLDVLFKTKDSQETFIFAGLKPTLLGIFLVGANLYKSYLRGATLKNMELQNANLYKADLREAILQEVNLQHANLNKAKLQGTDMPGVDMQGAELQGANLQDAALPLAKLKNADLWEANLQKADLQGADLRRANLWGVNLQNAILLSAELMETILRSAKLQGAMLKNANLRYADLQHANLQKANLQKANLQEACLRHANLQGADLQNADLQGTDLRDADLRGVDLRGADLRWVKNLDKAELNGAKVKGAQPPEAKGFKWPVGMDTTSDD